MAPTRRPPSPPPQPSSGGSARLPNFSHGNPAAFATLVAVNKFFLAGLIVFASLGCSSAPQEAAPAAEEPQAAAKSERTYFQPAAFSDALPFSPGVMVDGTLWIAGMVGSDPQTGEKPAAIADQTTQAMENIGLVLTEAGLGFSNLVSCHVQLTDMGNYAAMNEVYGSFFEEGKYPARTTLEMPALVGGAELEISCIAHADAEQISYVAPDPDVIPPAMGPYSSAVQGGKLLYLSGQGGRDPQTGETPQDLAEQTRQTMETIGHILSAANLDFNNALFTNVYYLGPENRATVDAAYMEDFQAGAAPSRGAFCLSKLPGDISTEITVVASDDDYITRLHPTNAEPGETESPAGLSQGILYLSAASAPDAGASIEDQLRAIFATQKERLALADMDLGHVVNANVYLADVADFDAMNAVFREFFPENPPARTTVGVREEGDRSGVKVEIALIAAQ